MSVAQFSIRERLRTGLTGSNRKGTLLSHLLGLILASEFVVGSAAGVTIPYVSLPLFTDWLDFPLRMLGIWLIVDRNWRVGRLKVGLWDVLAIAFPIIVGLAYPITALDPSVMADFDSYKRFIGTALRFYLIYL